MASGFALRHKNDVEGLGWIHQFGWLRSNELGRLVWPIDRYSRTRADRIIRGWLDRRLVIERKLPDGAGRAFVVSEVGARLLQDLGMDGKSGKDWGATDGEQWRPNATWRHDLIAAGVLASLYERGYQILPEKTLRSANPGLGKFPDGLAWNDHAVLWLEVESARKTGKAMRGLAAALCAVGRGTCAPISGKMPTMAVVAYSKDGKDERNLCINHRTRVSTAVQLAVRKDMTLLWAECELAGCGVAHVVLQEEHFDPSYAKRILKTLNAGGWKMTENEVLAARYGKIQAYVWGSDKDGWYYQIEGPGISESAANADNRTDARMGCANRLAMISANRAQVKSLAD